MRDELQQLADALAGELGRSVSIDDRQLRLLAHSAHAPADDALRVQSILTRRASPAMVAWAADAGIAEATAPVRLAPGIELAAAPRICAPIRGGEQLLGFVWVLDPDEAVSQPELEAIAGSARQAAVVLLREQVGREGMRRRQHELVARLVDGDSGGRAEAASALVEEQFILAGASVTALVARVEDRSGAPSAGVLELVLAGALERFTRSLPSRFAIALPRGDHGLVLVTDGRRPLSPEQRRRLCARLHRLAGEALPMNSALFDAWVAAGEPRAELADAVDSYRQAHKATRVAAGDPCVGATPLWEELGPYRTLARLPLDTLSLDDLHPGLVQLLADPAADELLHTLEVYFDAGGDARVAADSLALHRASLYQRLHKAERIAGIDIKRGDDRLALHMGLKAARLARLIPARSRS